VLSRIRELGKKAGAVLDPASPIAFVEQVLHLCDVLLVMTVNPGFGGQSFIEACLPKIEKLAGWIAKRGLKTKLEVDGGVAPGTIKRVVDAGANVLVAGTAVFGQKDYAAAIRALREAAAR